MSSDDRELMKGAQLLLIHALAAIISSPVLMRSTLPSLGWNRLPLTHEPQSVF